MMDDNEENDSSLELSLGWINQTVEEALWTGLYEGMTIEPEKVRLVIGLGFRRLRLIVQSDLTISEIMKEIVGGWNLPSTVEIDVEIKKEDSDFDTAGVPFLIKQLYVDLLSKYIDEADHARVNMMSGRGGITHVLRDAYGFIIPEKMKGEVRRRIRSLNGGAEAVLGPEKIYDCFKREFLSGGSIFSIPELHFDQKDGIEARVSILFKGALVTVIAGGNGRLDATSNAIKQYFMIDYELSIYEEHALTKGTSSLAAAYVGLGCGDELFMGAGVDPDIIKASVNALVTAVNHRLEAEDEIKALDAQTVEILNYMRGHMQTVTLDELADHFHLAPTYLSRLIKNKTGEVFSEHMKRLRLGRACALLAGSDESIQEIARRSGFPVTEHFNRSFKKEFGMSPGSYRKELNKQEKIHGI